MKSLESSWKSCLIAVVGFILGAWLFPIRTIRANPQARRIVRITSFFIGAAGSAARDTAVDGPIV